MLLCSTSPILFNIVLKALARGIGQENYKRVKKGNEVKLFLFADNTIKYLKDLAGSTRKLLDLILSVKLQNTNSTYKNHCLHLYSSSELVEEIKEKITHS